jgi:VCBS repeat-containing protein
MKRIIARLVAVIALVAAGIGIGRGIDVAGLTNAAPGPLQHGQSFALSSQEQQYVGTAAAVSKEVVQVENVGVGVGSGVIATSNGYIVTNNHVVANGSRYYVTLWDGRRLSAKVVGTDQADDLAVVKISASNLPVARFGDSAKLTIAQGVLAIGNPLGLGETVTTGVISALDRTVSEGQGASYLPNAIQTSAPINPGNSGGALVSLDGQVVGIPTLVASDPQVGGAAQGIGFAIPSNRVVDMVNQIITNGHVSHTGRAYLGVVSTDATSQTMINPFAPQQIPQPNANVQGAQVQQVGTGTPAARAGMLAGDIIVSVNGKQVYGQDTLLAALADLKVGQHVTVTVARSDAQGGTHNVTLHVTLGEAPANPTS